MLSGRVKTLRNDQLEFVQKRWAELPNWEDVYEPLTKPMRQNLRAEKTRTGIGEYKLLKGRNDAPDDLKYSDITKWLYSRDVKNVIKNHYGWSLEAWKQLPDTKKKVTKRISRTTLKSGHVWLTDEHRGALKSFREKGVAWTKIAATHAELSPNMISSWMAGRVKQVPKKLIGHLIEECEKALDKPDHRIPLTEDTLTELSELDNKLRFARWRIIEGTEEIPEGFNPALISTWLNRQTGTARKDYLEFVLVRLKQIVE